MSVDLKWRAGMIAKARAFLTERGVTEVMPNHLYPVPVSDPTLDVPQVCDRQGCVLGYLQSSPEYGLKRLLASAQTDLFSLASAFRLNESGERHALEFLMLEWYRVGMPLGALMDETADLVRAFVGPRAVARVRYKDAFKALLGLCPLESPTEELVAEARQRANYQSDDLSRSEALNLLCSMCVEPSFDPNAITLLTDYPTNQAALARVVEDAEGYSVAARFELFTQGVELANGYWELNDATEQRRRMQSDIAHRQQAGLPTAELDEELLAVVDQLPDCSGVALGFDRLLMLAGGHTSLKSVSLF